MPLWFVNLVTRFWGQLSQFIPFTELTVHVLIVSPFFLRKSLLSPWARLHFQAGIANLVFASPSIVTKYQAEMTILLFLLFCAGRCLWGNFRADNRVCNLIWRSSRWSHWVAHCMTPYEFTTLVKDQDPSFGNALYMCTCMARSNKIALPFTNW